MTLDYTLNGVISDFNMPRLKSRQSSDKQKEVMEPGIVRKLDSSPYHIFNPWRFLFHQTCREAKKEGKFKRFRQASEMFSKPECQQVNMFVYCAGNEGEDLNENLCLSEWERNMYAKV